MKRDFILACLLVLAAAVPAVADTVVYYREGQRIEPEFVRQVLAQDAPAGAVRTRSIRLLDTAAVAETDRPQNPPARSAVAPKHRETPPAAANALAVPVQFAFDSAEILPAARGPLDALAAGIQLLPPQRRVTIEGHTDASGSEDYNLELSRRRAAAVKAYLVQQHGIDARRLNDVGQGERQPLAGLDPSSGENRRVQFRGS